MDAVELFATPNHAAHQRLEEQFIRDALAKTGDSISQAAQHTLKPKPDALQELGVEYPQFPLTTRFASTHHQAAQEYRPPDLGRDQPPHAIFVVIKRDNLTHFRDINAHF